jgi:hypothetical protein
MVYNLDPVNNYLAILAKCLGGSTTNVYRNYDDFYIKSTLITTIKKLQRWITCKTTGSFPGRSPQAACAATQSRHAAAVSCAVRRPSAASPYRGLYSLRHLSMGKIPYTHYSYLINYSNLDSNYPNLRYRILNSDSNFDYPKLIWLIRVISPSTQTTRTTQIFVYFCIYHVLLVEHLNVSIY